MTHVDGRRIVVMHQEVIADLDSKVRLLDDPAQILQTLVETLGQHLQVDRCLLTEVVDFDGQGDSATDRAPDIEIRALWVAATPTGNDPIHTFAPVLSRQFASDLRQGRIVAVEDAEIDAPTDLARSVAAELGVRAIVIVPFLRAGRWVAGITVHSSRPRRWTDAELSIIEAAVKRTWPLVERSRAVEALAESENRLRHAAEAANFAYFDFDLRSGEGFWSPDFSRVLRRKKEVAAPNSLDQLVHMVHPDDRQRFIDLIAGATGPEPGNVIIGEFRHETEANEICWFLFRGSVQYSASDVNPIAERIRGVMMDITPRKQDEEERLNALNAAAHDLKNPVATIRALAQVGMRLQSYADVANPQLTEIMESIETATDRLVAVIGDLLDTAHLRAGRSLPLQQSPLDIVRLLRDSIDSWREMYPDREFRDQLPSEGISGCWDALRLTRVLDNLIGNAVKFSPEGGPIGISLETRVDQGQQYVAIAVADRGIGIASADLARVQRTFERGSNVPGSIPGTGMGLVAARLIVEQHGGSLRLDSAEGAGTTVAVHLPVDACPEEPAD